MSTTTTPHESEQPAPQNTPAPRGDLSGPDLSRIAQDLQIRKVQVEAVVQLLDEENTIPFITRYRKERTGGLDEEVLRIIQERVGALRAMADRRQSILRTIESQGKLTDELRAQINAADNPKRLEDLYLPFKPKKRSLAQAARDKGLEKLALAIWENDEVVSNLEEVLQTLINPEQGLNTTDEILAGAGHIIAEIIAESADVRAGVRAVLWDTARLTTQKSEKLAEGQGLEYKDYFDYGEPVRQIPPHRVLAINRGEKDSALTVKFDWDSVTGKRVVEERVPLPKKGGPAAPVAAAPETPAEPVAAEAGDGGTSPAVAPRPPRGMVPFVSRRPDLEAHPHHGFIDVCIDDALARLLVPSLEREIRRELTGRAEGHAVVVFARNLRSKLLAAPMPGKRVLAVDPAFRTGCKLAVMDETGNLLDHGVVHPHAPQNKKAEAKAVLERMIRKHGVQVIAIGNGTACRETEEIISDLIAEFEARRNGTAVAPGQAAPVEEKAPEAAPSAASAPEASEPAVAAATSEAEANPVAPETAAPAEAPPAAEGEKSADAPVAAAEAPVVSETPPAPPAPPPPPPEPLPEPAPDLAYVIVNEAGASVYSASPVGREEFPNFDATLRGTISIGRRLQDPLSELVKIDPQHVGVGLYQHDVSPKHLRESLEGVVESAVNTVGVDLNTASVPLLRHVSGMNALTAQNVVEYRKANGNFKTREQLRDVPGIGPVKFVQAAGFLKVRGDDPLDVTWIHPESYPAARQLLADLGVGVEALADPAKLAELREKLNGLNIEEAAARLNVGVPTLKDILDALARPGRDPREDLPPPVFKKGILKLEDLQPGMELKGTVLNVVDFGAFIDIGLKDSGLVHISQMANRYVKSPYDVVAVGDVVAVWVIRVEGERNRVSLTMIAPGSERRPPERRGGPGNFRGGPPPGEGRPMPPREARPPREPRQGDAPRPQPQREGAGAGPRRDGPPREGGFGGPRPPREGGGPGRGGPGRGGRDDGKRSGLPARGTTRIGGGGNKFPGQTKKTPPAETPAPNAEGAPQVEGAAAGDQPVTPKPKKAAQPKRSAGPKLSQDAITGKEPLSGFGELQAFFEARTKKPDEGKPADEGEKKE